MREQMVRTRVVALLSAAMLLVWSAIASCALPSWEPSNEVSELEGEFPAELALPADNDNGPYDPSVATDPESGRVWMVYSRVVGPAGEGMVSTHLAFSDDGGASWKYSNLINESVALEAEELPAEFTDPVSAHWNHEVPSLAYDPGAPADERWRMIWHRYLHVDDGSPGNEDRRFSYGWIATRAASDPALLAAAPEENLFSALGYHSTAEIEAYNDAVSGRPAVELNQLHPDLSDALVISEPGMTAGDGRLYVSLLMRDHADGFVILLSLDHATAQWSYVDTLLTPAHAKSLRRAWENFSAPELFVKGSQGYLLVSPVDGLYDGALLLRLNLANGNVEESRSGRPLVVYEFAATDGAIQSGVPAYDPGLSATGIILGDVGTTEPQFSLYATGIVPGEIGAE